ncbi:MAG: glycosyltransferase [Geobacteraceae bacterium]|nr:glycosyltransferase [Geobacteraceae bacterium]
MAVRYYCTYFDKNYLVRGVALLSSLNRHEKDFVVYAVCLDELTLNILHKLRLPNVIAVPLHEVEFGDAALAFAKSNRSKVEYYWTLTPSIIRYLLERFRLEFLTYLDADLFFYSSPDPIYMELGNASVLIHGHRFAADKQHLAIHGNYNVGLMVFRSDSDGMACLSWWRERCNEWCYARVENGKYGDQLYLDHFKQLFDNVRVLQHPGAGIAPWNHEQYRISRHPENGAVLIDGYPLIFYHFSALKFVSPDLIFPVEPGNYDLPSMVLKECYLPYLHALHGAFADVRRVQPDFISGLYGNTFYEAPFVGQKSLHAIIIENMPRRNDWMQLDDIWNCYNASQLSDPLQRECYIAVTKQLPIISIVTPSFNQAQYLEECIDSILSQNYPNLEYIIMDGGSTDESVEIIRKYEKHLKYWQSQPDNGQYAAIDEGLRMSTGTAMTWLNSDDRLHPGALELIAELFTEQPEVSWVTGRPNGLDVQGRQSWVLDMLPLWSREKYLNYEYHSPFIQQEGTFWRRELWEKAGGYIRHDLKYAGDLELWTRFFRYAQLYSVDALIAGYRQHPQQKMAGFLGLYHQEAKAVLDFERELFQYAQSRQLRPAPLPIIPKQKDRHDS